ncbi:MAG: PilW family protein [Rhodocyclaceae bacterium]|nr:PilW family protein [Rhodocyclaceae bacterium]MDQ8000406.1 PilW family protein [Pseudomonadota bacterium]
MKPLRALHRPCRPPRSKAGGFTLVELMVALVIGLVILAAVLAVYLSSGRASQLSQAETQLNEDGVIALNLIQQQLKQAGYSQQIIPASGASIAGNFAGLAVRGCDHGFTSNTAAFDSLACASTGSGSAAIAIRYEATKDNTMPVGGSAPLPSNCMGNGIVEDLDSQASPAPATAPAKHALADNRYMVTVATGQAPMLSCSAKEKTQSVNAIVAAQPLLANVEDMQILYGVASRPSLELASTYDLMRHQIVGYYDAASVDALTPSGALANATEDRWGRVLSVRVCLTMRSDKPVRDAPPGAFTYKNCKNVDVTPTDGYLRKTYTTTVLLRNRMLIQ